MPTMTTNERAEAYSRIHERLAGTPLAATFAEMQRELEEATRDYNGWKNYPTWAVHLWLTNDETSYDYWTEAASYCVARAAEEQQHEEFPRTARGLLADRLKEEVHDAAETDNASAAADLLGYALDQVEWYEVADAFLESAADAD